MLLQHLQQFDEWKTRELEIDEILSAGKHESPPPDLVTLESLPRKNSSSDLETPKLLLPSVEGNPAGAMLEIPEPLSEPELSGKDKIYMHKECVEFTVSMIAQASLPQCYHTF